MGGTFFEDMVTRQIFWLQERGGLGYSGNLLWFLLPTGMQD
jgi:hypothetical protein